MTLLRDDTARDPDDFRPDDDLVDQLSKLGKALGHPIRVHIAVRLLKVDEASPKEIAEIIGEPLGTVAYHLRYMSNLGFVTLERLVPRRGALEHKYSLSEALGRALPVAGTAIFEPKVKGRRRGTKTSSRGTAKK